MRDLLTSLNFEGKTVKGQSITLRLKNLAEAIQNEQRAENDGEGRMPQDQQMVEEIKRVAELVEGRESVYEMSGDELEEVGKWLDVVKHTLTEANRMHGTGLDMTATEAAARTCAELQRKKQFKDKKGFVRMYSDMIGTDMRDSFSFFEGLGGTAEKVFNGLRKGLDKMVGYNREAVEYVEELTHGLDMGKVKKGMKVKETFKLSLPLDCNAVRNPQRSFFIVLPSNF